MSPSRVPWDVSGGDGDLSGTAGGVVLLASYKSSVLGSVDVSGGDALAGAGTFGGDGGSFEMVSLGVELSDLPADIDASWWVGRHRR